MICGAHTSQSIAVATLGLRGCPQPSEVKARIEAEIPGATAEVQSPDNVHFNARVVADAFAGLSRIEQHRLVYAAFEGELGGEIHALQLKTETP